MDSAAQAEIFMVAERAVGQAANDLRAEFGLKFQEITGIITGVKGVLDGEIGSLRDDISKAFKENNKSLRAELSNIGESIQTDLVKQIEKYNTEVGTEVGKMIVETNKEINKSVEIKMNEKEQAIRDQIDLLEININESLDNIKKNGINNAGSGTRDHSKTNRSS